MIASVESAETLPAPTFWIWRLILVLLSLPTDTTPFPVSVLKLSETFVPPIVSSVIALAVAVTDESPIATSPSAMFAVAPRPNANDLSFAAFAPAPRAVALIPEAAEPTPIDVALTAEAFARFPIATVKFPEATASGPTAAVQQPVA